MLDNGTQMIVSAEIVRELREGARQGASVRELVQIIRCRMGCKNDAIIPVLSGFVHAFRLPLIKVLPLREWLGSDNDEEIDSLLLPEIRSAREKWDLEEPVEAGK